MSLLVDDEQGSQDVAVVFALGVVVGDIHLELDVAVIDVHVLVGVQGVDVDAQVHGIDHTASDVY